MLVRGGEPDSIVICRTAFVGEDEHDLLLDVNGEASEHLTGPGREVGNRVEDEFMWNCLARFRNFVELGSAPLRPENRHRNQHTLDENRIVTGVRIDKWLWAARFYKTRTLASKACELGRVEANGQSVKAAREVHAGDILRVKNESGEFQIEVLALSEMRGPASVAQALYRETEESRESRMKIAQDRKLVPAVETMREGKPSKRDRREIDRLRGRRR